MPSLAPPRRSKITSGSKNHAAKELGVGRLSILVVEVAFTRTAGEITLEATPCHALHALTSDELAAVLRLSTYPPQGIASCCQESVVSPDLCNEEASSNSAKYPCRRNRSSRLFLFNFSSWRSASFKADLHFKCYCLAHHDHHHHRRHMIYG